MDRAIVGNRIPTRLSVTALLSVALVAFVPSAGASDDEIYHPDNWNNYMIYLSPADHENPGCGDYHEGENMHKVAHVAGVKTDLGAGSLQERGYKVRIGHGTYIQAVSRSNAWDSNRHMPLHSNARSSQQCGFSSGGTQGFYCCGSSKGEDLARKLKNKVGDASPGEALEFVDDRPGLYELNSTNMPAAYLEAEFHDWNTGKDWLVDRSSWGWRIAYAVDLHLGYPR